MADFARALSSTGAILPGTWLGKYEIVDRIGGGGMAEIYMARSHQAGGVTQLAVIKRVLPHLARDPDFIRMFLNEAKITASLDHPNIAHVKEVGRAGEEFFLALELIHGVDVRKVLKASAGTDGVPRGVALAIVVAVADALHYAHSRGIVHRDVTPSNIMITYEGHTKVLDFGIAKAALTAMTRAGTVKGKVGYMSPEQCMAETVDRRSDVFALGILLFELTVGRKLFRGDSDFAIMNQITQGRITPPSRIIPDYPEPLERIILKALAVSPDDRFQSARELAQALEDFADRANVRMSTAAVGAWVTGLVGSATSLPDAPVKTEPSQDAVVVATDWSLPGEHKRSRSVGIGLLAGALGIAIGGVTVGMLRDSPPPPRPERSAVPATRAEAPATIVTEPQAAPPEDPAVEPEPEPEPEPALKPRKPKRKRKKRKNASAKRNSSSSLLPPSRRGPSK